MLDHRGTGVPRIRGDQGDALLVVPDGHEGAHRQRVGELGELRQGGRLQASGKLPGPGRPGPVRLDPAAVVAHQQGVVLKGAEDPIGDGAVHAHGIGEFSDGGGRGCGASARISRARMPRDSVWDGEACMLPAVGVIGPS